MTFGKDPNQNEPASRRAPGQRWDRRRAARVRAWVHPVCRRARLCVAVANKRLDRRQDKRASIVLALLGAAGIVFVANRLTAF
jgi:hypothetical protein